MEKRRPWYYKLPSSICFAFEPNWADRKFSESTFKLLSLNKKYERKKIIFLNGLSFAKVGNTIIFYISEGGKTFFHFIAYNVLSTFFE